MTDPLSLLRLFSTFLGLSTKMADIFAEKHPELIRQYSDGAPKPAPTEDVDPEVREAIERGET
jgi:hypothetical protein